MEAVSDGSGVVVLMDLGSALLSAEMALEFLPPELDGQVFLSAAPLVEGAMAAAVQASTGATPELVLAEAQSALNAKASQLGIEIPEFQAGANGAATASDPTAMQISLVVTNRLGLHARPAARFVTTAGKFDADMIVHKGQQAANAKSINQVATLGVRQGDEITVSASGPDAAAALAAIQTLAAENFGDVDDEDAVENKAPVIEQKVASESSGAINGIPASPGVAIGPAALYRPSVPEATAYEADDPAVEWSRLQEAINEAAQEIVALQKASAKQVGQAKADIFEAHALIIRDPALSDAVRQRLMNSHENAEWAWQQEISVLASAYREMDDPYMQARATDVEDVGRRVLQKLLGEQPPSMEFAEPSILVAADLNPSDTAQLDPERVLGICTEFGGATAHSAILARALGIPAIVGLGHAIWTIAEGQTIAVDGESGLCWTHPDNGQLAELETQREKWQADRQQAKIAGQGTAVTWDGYSIEVAANVGSPNDITRALEFGAEGVGLFRTEFLFMDREEAPSEEEQYEAYHQATSELNGAPLIIRTLDVGGDKPLPYLDLGEEANPFLGWRGIRFCLDRPQIFKPQLRAILRASVTDDGRPANVKVMFPMIGTVSEVRAARRMLLEAQEELRAIGLPFDERMEVGIMVEVPSAVAVADQLAREVDFFSIGTNDLTQYTMAADRGNSKVASLVNALQPSVLRLIKQTAEAGRTAGIWTGMCGELAGNSLATPLLLGLGVTELSMSAPSIPQVKETVRNLTMPEAQRIAHEALEMATADDVVAYLQGLQTG
ncbi:MAG: phosphoenolpyruvate--protein phosphotransferase [Chloroflexota bacterium]